MAKLIPPQTSKGLRKNRKQILRRLKVKRKNLQDMAARMVDKNSTLKIFKKSFIENSIKKAEKKKRRIKRPSVNNVSDTFRKVKVLKGVTKQARRLKKKKQVRKKR